MNKLDILDWNSYFMIQAITASLRSKDPSTKVGCYIADKNNHPISTGYNGFPANTDESKFTWAKDPSLPYHQTKYAYVLHAELNAVVHAKEDLEGARVYVTLFPCNECAKLLASKKVKEVYYLDDKNVNTESGLASKVILEAANIKVIRLSIDVNRFLELLTKQLASIKMD